MNSSLATPHADLVVVGAGIVGLAHAVEATARGLQVDVVERDQRAVGASVRNFGHLCVTAQAGDALDYAIAAREQWIRLGEKAGFDVAQTGALVVARSACEADVLEEFAGLRGAEQVALLDPAQVRDVLPGAGDDVVGGAHLPLDVRVDPRAALPAIAAWLEAEGVRFHWGTHVGGMSEDHVSTSRGPITTDQSILAAGHDVDRLFPALADEYDVRRCQLQMLEVAPPGNLQVAPAVLTGTSMLRYPGFAGTAAAARLRDEIAATRPELLAVDMNLMFTQRPDGSIVLGDTHHYQRTLSPFEEEDISRLLLREGSRLLSADLVVRRRWRGVYASSAMTDFLVEAPSTNIRVVSVTSGIGMTTSFGLAPSVLDSLL